MRKTKSIEELLPWLYLKGISHGRLSGSAPVARGSRVSGPIGLDDHPARSSSGKQNTRLGRKRSLAGKKYVYVWADGVYFNIRLEEDRPCILVLMGATEDGQKELLAIVDGYRESEQSWTELLLDVKSRGLAVDPKLATGDGALGFWKALPKVFPKTRAQRCWFHKSGNVTANGSSARLCDRYLLHRFARQLCSRRGLISIHGRSRSTWHQQSERGSEATTLRVRRSICSLCDRA